MCRRCRHSHGRASPRVDTFPRYDLHVHKVQTLGGFAAVDQRWGGDNEFAAGHLEVSLMGKHQSHLSSVMRGWREPGLQDIILLIVRANHRGRFVKFKLWIVAEMACNMIQMQEH